MTAQFSDRFQYSGIDYVVSAISERKLFDPAAFKMKPRAAHTGCYRGYVAGFTVSSLHLVLDSIHVNLLKFLSGQRIVGPAINGISPSEQGTYKGFNNYYKGLNYPIDYTGGVLIANEFIRELYVHGGFQSPWKYKKVIELIFENGILKKEFDRSESIAHLRGIILDANNNSPLSYPLASGDRDRIRSLAQRMFECLYKIV